MCLTSSALSVHVSNPYSITENVSALSSLNFLVLKIWLSFQIGVNLLTASLPSIMQRLISFDELPFVYTSEPRYINSSTFWQLFSTMVGGNIPARSITIALLLFLWIDNPYLLLDSSIHFSIWLIFVSDLAHNVVSSAKHRLLIFLPLITTPFSISGVLL